MVGEYHSNYRIFCMLQKGDMVPILKIIALLLLGLPQFNIHLKPPALICLNEKRRRVIRTRGSEG
jgi:hypothetical protein